MILAIEQQTTKTQYLPEENVCEIEDNSTEKRYIPAETVIPETEFTSNVLGSVDTILSCGDQVVEGVDEVVDYMAIFDLSWLCNPEALSDEVNEIIGKD
jgi:hypothetical protein